MDEWRLQEHDSQGGEEAWNGREVLGAILSSIDYDSEMQLLPKKAVGPSKSKPTKAGEYVLERLRATAS